MLTIVLLRPKADVEAVSSRVDRIEVHNPRPPQARSLTRARILVRMAQRLALLTSEPTNASTSQRAATTSAACSAAGPATCSRANLPTRCFGTAPDQGGVLRWLVEQLQHEQLPRRQPQQPRQRQQQRGISLRQDHGDVRIAGRSRAVSSLPSPEPRSRASSRAWPSMVHPRGPGPSMTSSVAEYSRLGGPPGPEPQRRPGPGALSSLVHHLPAAKHPRPLLALHERPRVPMLQHEPQDSHPIAPQAQLPRAAPRR